MPEDRGFAGSHVLETIPHSWIVPALLFVFALSGFLSLRQECATFDETTHLPSGITYLDRWDFRHNPEHPPLAKMWAALPVWLSGRAIADYTSPHWMGTHVPASDPQRSRASQWIFGYELLNGPRGDLSRKDPGRLLVPARIAVLVLGLLLALVAYAWSRELWGRNGALLTLFLCCVSPTLLAHARLVTTDLPLALGFTATLWCSWRFLRAPAGSRAAATGVALGAALLTKYSALFLLPLLAVLGAAAVIFDPRGQGRATRARSVATGLVASLAVAWVVLWAGYGFRYAAVTDPGYRLEWESMNLSHGSAARLIAWGKDVHVLPEAYLFGLAYTAGGANARLAFLNGAESVTGWWIYFPEAFLLKTPPAFLALLGWAIVAGAMRSRLRSFRGWFVAIPVLLYFAVSMASRLNIGHRHLVPIYPLLFVGAGSLAVEARGKLRNGVLAALLLGSVASFVAATPRYLSYFNVLAGGSEGGWRYLLDSNIDWGQDLPRLKKWMDSNGVQDVYLAYFGTADPLAYGIRFHKVHMVYDFHPDLPAERPRSGDVLAVSVTLLQGVYLDRDRSFAEEAVRKGLVRNDALKPWLALRDERVARAESYPTLPEWSTDTGVLTPEARREVESALIDTWMANVRTTLTPIGKAGDSIFLYRMP